MWPTIHAQGAAVEVDVGDMDGPELGDGEGVEQGEQAGERFVGVDAAGGPAAEQAALLADREGLAGEAAAAARGIPAVGSTSTILLRRAQVKNWRAVPSRRRRLMVGR